MNMVRGKDNAKQTSLCIPFLSTAISHPLVSFYLALNPFSSQSDRNLNINNILWPSQMIVILVLTFEKKPQPTIESRVQPALPALPAGIFAFKPHVLDDGAGQNTSRNFYCLISYHDFLPWKVSLVRVWLHEPWLLKRTVKFIHWEITTIWKNMVDRRGDEKLHTKFSLVVSFDLVGFIVCLAGFIVY